VTRKEIQAELEIQQAIQMHNPPSSEAWQAASKRIHELARELTGKEPQDACGRAAKGRKRKTPADARAVR
jgi:hypothetical protein